jgi:hypothetical protein
MRNGMRSQAVADPYGSAWSSVRRCPVDRRGHHLPVSVRDRLARRSAGVRPWQTIWNWHRRVDGEGIQSSADIDRAGRAVDVQLGSGAERLLTAADTSGMIDWAVSVDSTIARAHQHATNVTATQGWIELHESAPRAC